MKILYVCGLGLALSVMSASAGTSISEGVLTFDTSDGDILYTDAIGADISKIVKVGAGTAHVETGSFITNAFTGAIEVREGTLWSPYLSNLGKMSTLEVMAGATLDVSGYSTGSTSTSKGDIGQFRSAVVTIAGDGVDGVGAICLTNGPWVSTNNDGDKMFRNVNLSGDAKVNASYRWGMAYGTLNLNGHTLTIAAGNSNWNRQFFLWGETINPNGADGEYGHIKLVSGKMTLKSNAAFNGDENNHFIVDGPTAHLQDDGTGAANAIPWTMEWRGGKLWGASYAASAPYKSGHWKGPVTCVGGAVITNDIGSVGHVMVWSGPVTNVAVCRKSGLLTISNATELTNFKHVEASAHYPKSTRFYGTGQDWTFVSVGITGGFMDFRNPGGTMRILGNTACYWSMGENAPCRHTVVQFHEGSYTFNKLDFGFRQGVTQNNHLMVRDGGDVNFDYIMNGYTSNPDTCTVGSGGGGTNVITVTGDGSKLTMRTSMSNQHNGTGTLILNVTDGASYTSPSTYHNISAERGSKQRIFINVDGGTLGVTKNNGYGTSTKGSTNYWPTALTVYENGATIDTSAATGAKYFQGPILCPRPGRRIKSIPLPSDSKFLKTNVYMPGAVVISGGSGEGASGFLQMDENTMYPTNVLLTSHGFGYGADDQPKATLWTNGVLVTSLAVNCEMENEPAVSEYRGIVKTGAKDLVLQAANTYYGLTEVAGGKLVFEVADGRPLDSSVKVAEGATVDFSGYAQQMPDLSGCGQVANGSVTVTNSLVVSFDDLASGRSLSLSGALALGAEASVNLTGTFTKDDLKDVLSSDTLAATADGGISGAARLLVNGAENPYAALAVNTSADGTKLYLRYANGTMVILR